MRARTVFLGGVVAALVVLGAALAAPGTRQLRIVLNGRPVSGGAIYGYADNISAGLTTGSCEPVLAVRCVGGALVATVKPASVARTRRVRFTVRGGARTRKVSDAVRRSPAVSRWKA